MGREKQNESIKLTLSDVDSFFCVKGMTFLSHFLVYISFIAGRIVILKSILDSLKRLLNRLKKNEGCFIDL